MRILSRYLVRRYLVSLLLALAAFVSIFLVVDLTDRLNEFLDRGFEGRAILAYYFFYVPYVIVLALPMASLLACLFSVGDLSRRLELTAMKAAGVSLAQILLPVAGTALILSLLALALGDLVAPGANRRRAEIGRGGALEASSFTVRENLVLRDVNGQVLSIGRYDVGAQVGHIVLLDRYDRGADRREGSPRPARDPRLISRLTAKSMRWAEGRWAWQDGVARTFEKARETEAPFSLLVPEGLTLRPEDIQRPDRKPEEMSYGDLQRAVERKRLVGVSFQRDLMELQLKIAFPFASLIMVLFGAPLAASLRRTGRGTTFGFCLLLAFIFYGSIKGCQALGGNGLLAPAVAAWLPNMLFAGTGAGIFLRAHE